MRAERLDTALRQEQILQAALNLISNQGMRGLSVAGLARGVGLVPSAIYRHFKSKEEVLDAALGLIEDKLLYNIKLACEETQDPIERLKLILIRHVRTLRENRAIPHLVFSVDVYRGHPERKAQVYKTITTYLERIGEIVREGQKRGRIRRDLSPETVSLMFLGMIQPAGVLWFLSDGRFDITKQAGKAWEVFAGAIEAKTS